VCASIPPWEYFLLIFGCLIFLGLLIAAIYFAKRRLVKYPWKYFPESIHKPYDDYPKNWNKLADGVHTKEIFDGSEEYNLMKSYLQNLQGEVLAISKASVVCNYSLWETFRNTHANLLVQKQNSERIFYKKDWKNKDDGLKKFVYQAFEDKVDSWDFNAEMEIPIIPAVHGTQTDTALKICSTGFAALSATDGGYFGKGIYFTTSCPYALPYAFLGGDNPCIIITLLIPGNVYPVTEHHKGPKSLFGGAIRPGYNIHYVLTEKDGNCISKPIKNFFDELVVDQEMQIVPIFLLELDGKASMNLAKKFERDIPRPNATDEVPVHEGENAVEMTPTTPPRIDTKMSTVTVSDDADTPKSPTGDAPLE